MQFTTVKSKEKDYDMYFKSEKLVHSNQEHEKKWIPAIWNQKKTGSQLQFTTVKSKEKDYDIYLKSEKLVHSQ